MDRSMHLAGPVEAIGGTPLVRLQRVVPAGAAWVLAKWESAGPGRSGQDRIARALVAAAEADGRLARGGTLVTASANAFGRSLAVVAAARGYLLIVVTPETVEAEWRESLERFGAEVLLTPAGEGAAGAASLLARLRDEHPEYIVLDPGADPHAVVVQRTELADEIVQATSGRVDAFVCGVETGATLAGVGAALRAVQPAVRIVAVRLAQTAEWLAHQGSRHAVREAVSTVPIAQAVIDETVEIEPEEALAMADDLARREGLPVGPRAGANVAAAVVMARQLGLGQVVVTTLPDACDWRAEPGFGADD